MLIEMESSGTFILRPKDKCYILTMNNISAQTKFAIVF